VACSGVPAPRVELVARKGVGSWGALYADGDRSTGYEVLDHLDVLHFMMCFESRRPYADCDRNGLYDTFDLLCFMQSFESK